jgi:hypothetical protein
MESEKMAIRFVKIRELAWEMDILIGIESRKLVLAGNEKLALSIQEAGWKNWVTNVERRLFELPDINSTKSSLLKNRLLPLKEL